jgi:uncharacterized protein (TIGR02001 family)
MKTMKKTLIASALILGSTAVLAEESAHSVSANVALTTDYIYRGFTQTDENPAIQGGFDYAHTSGFYAGIWGSNVDFNDGDEASVELDYYAGFSGELDGGLGWDLGYIYYDYPGAASNLNYDFQEVYAGLSYTLSDTAYEPTFGLSIAYSDDFFGATGDATYVSASLDLSLPQGYAIGASLSSSDIDKSDDYADWKVYVSKDFADIGFELAYTDSDVDGAASDGRVLFTISKAR